LIPQVPRPRLLLLPIGDASNPGTRLRALAYLPFLRERGLDVDVRFPYARGRGSPLRLLEILRDLTLASRYDAVLLYRKTFPSVSASLLAGRARKLIYEFDDAIYLPAPSEPQDAETRARYRRNFNATLAAADHLVAGNSHLAQQAGERPVTVLPTAVDLETFRPRQKAAHESCVFGWIGTVENFPEWLELVPAFRRLLEAHPNASFKVVSNGALPEVDLPVTFERFSVERQAAALEAFDVGLMPLADNDWNRGKCGAKALQCMALGMPVVVSPVGMNRDLVEPGDSGFLATSEGEWVDAMDRLAGSAELRARLGARSRKLVEERYALEKVGARMAELIAGTIGP
jgi:glycosyltransferase involved in cell wall biosynthesis